MSLYANNNGKVRFNPVQCTEDMLKQLAPTPGYLYLTTDTKKIYLGTQEQKLPMCAASGFFYGTKEIEYDNSGIAPDPEVTFFFTEVEGDDIPEVDDLILNVDGCFYRVKNVSKESQEIETIRLTLQGSGGGGGGSSSGGNFSIKVLGNKDKVYSSEATEMLLPFKGFYNGTEENRISLVYLILNGQDEPFYTSTEEMAFNEEQVIDLIEYKKLFNSNSTSGTIYVQDLYGNEKSTSFSIRIVDLSLTQLQEDLLASLSPTYDYFCNLSGATKRVTEKQIVFTFYNENNMTTPVIPAQIRTLNVSEEGKCTTTLDLSNLQHGSYVLKVDASAKILGSTATIHSNTLVHKIAKFDAANGSPILQVITPEKTEQYTNIPMSYLLTTNETNKEYTLRISLNGEVKTELKITSNVLDTYNLYFEEKGTYKLECYITELGISYTTYLEISGYTGELPIIDPTMPELMLYLNPKGKSNNATDKDIWKDYNGKYTANVTGLHYGNADGWLMDAAGTSFLKLTSGAKVSLPAFKPFAVDPTATGKTGMTIELDFEVNGVLDYDTEIIKCISTNEQGTIQVGFVITGDKVKFYNSRLNDSLDDKGKSVGSLMSLNIIEGKRIRISFVIEPKSTGDFPMCYAYLNGILSGAVIYKHGDNFKDSSDYPAQLQIDASDAQVKIYGIRFYRTAFNDRNILNNFTASLPTLEERQARYDTNNVYDSMGNISYLKVDSEEYDFQIPIMKITGGYPTKKDSKWELQDDFTADDARLPTGKKDYRLIDVEVKYPKNDYFAGYEDYKYINEFENGKTMLENKGNKASNGGAIMYGQGTSSMEYPVKNLRIRFKKDKYWYRVRPDIQKVEIICMKADYMESSGSHNTGTANLVDAIYDEAGFSTPGQDAFGTDDNTIVTCIKGHPCLIFYAPSPDQEYQYVGKYNLNLDKATPKPFGFDHKEGFGYLPVGEEYYEVEYDDDGEKVLGQLQPDESGDYVGNETLKAVTEENTINSIHCFEFLDNAVEVCNFLGKKQISLAGNVTEEQFKNNISKNYYVKNGDEYVLASSTFDPEAVYYINRPMAYEKTWYDTFENSDGDKVPGWTLGFESRYPEDRIGYHDADMLYPLASWINKLYLQRIQEEEAGLTPDMITRTYDYKVADKYEENVEYFIADGADYTPAYPNADNFDNDTYYTRTLIDETFTMKSLEHFKREYQCYLNKDFLISYYLITEALLMADSRVKNMMIATWSKAARSYIDCETGETKNTNNYIFYPIFYDMDTMLGLDNTGVFRFDYSSEDTDSSIYNGDEILWNFVRDALASELTPYYNKLEAKLVADKMLPYYNNNQANMANEAFYNGDGRYKYIRPAIEGYDDDLNGEHIDPGAAPYLYALQGDRSLMRDWFVVNRMKFLRGKRNSNQYQSGDRIVFRWYYPTGAEADERLQASAVAVPPTNYFDFTSLKTGYSGVKLGANGNVYNQRFDGEQTKRIILPEASAANGTEAYLLGLSNLTDLGDLSDKYMQKFIISSTDVRLKNLTLGNPHKDYYNPYWRPQGGASAEIILTGCTYLEKFNLQNCSYNSTLNFTNCPAIQEILLTGSSVTGITLPDGGLVTELRLPTSVTSLNIKDHPNLDKFSIGGYNYGPSNKIGVDGNYLNDYTKLNSVSIVGSPKIDTYAIVKGSDVLENYYFQDVNWEITENDTYFCRRGKVSDGFVPVEGVQYYIKNTVNGVTTTIEYDPFNEDHKEKNLYERVSMLDANGNVVCISALEYLKIKTPIGTTTENALSGTITINIPGAKVDQLTIYEKYTTIYPNVKIKYGNNMEEVVKAPEINFYRNPLIISINDELNDENIDIDALEPYYSVLVDGNTTLQTIVNNSNFSLPTISSTTTKTYEFTGQWMDYANNNKTIYYQDVNYSGDVDDSNPFVTFIPKSDMHLIPIFKEWDRVYTVNFQNDDNNVIASVGMLYEQTFDKDFYPFIDYWCKDDDDKLGEYERYGFRGWISEADYLKVQDNANYKPTVYDFDTLKVIDDMTLYTYYEIEDARYVASNSVLFTFSPITIKGVSGYSIAINPYFRHSIAGKMTLPNKYNNSNIIAIGDFKSMTNLREVYFLNKDISNYLSILDGEGFNGETDEGQPALQYIDLPKSIIYIGEKAFLGCYYLASEIELNDNVELASQAFYDCYELRLNKLPSNMTNLSSFVFTNCRKLNIDRLGSNDGSHPLTTIGTFAFYGACLDTKTLDIGSSVTSIGKSAFTNGYQNVLMVNDYSNYTAEELIALGLPAGTINDIE